jgi:hypothetical protein
MNRNLIKILLIFFFIVMVSYLIIPVSASPTYGIKDNSEYIWNVTENISGQNVSYQLTARFNLKQNKVSITKYFHGNGSSENSQIQMSEFGKYIIPQNDRNGVHNYFYTRNGAVNFPRHVIFIETNESTCTVEYETGIVLYYESDLDLHVLISGDLPLSWVVWIILAVTGTLTCMVLLMIYKKSRKSYPAIIYEPPHSTKSTARIE